MQKNWIIQITTYWNPLNITIALKELIQIQQITGGFRG